jgi:hypothetical protein
VAREQAFEYIAPALARGYELSVSGGALVFRRRWRPAWTILVAVFMFPIGLAALIHQHEDEIMSSSTRACAAGRRCSPTGSSAERAPRLCQPA